MYLCRVSIPTVEGRYTKFLGENDPHTMHLLDAVGPDNFETFQILGVAWTSLLADSSLGYKPRRVAHRFFLSFLSDPLGVISSLSSLAHELRKSLCRQGESISIRYFLDDMKKLPIFREYLAFYRTQDPSLLRYLLTFLEFGKKIAYSDPQLDSTAFRSWYQVEKKLGELHIPSWVKNVRLIMDILCSKWSDATILPKHGSGAVANRKTKGVEMKNRKFYIPAKIQYMYFREKIGQATPLYDLSPSGDSSRLARIGLDASRLMFVPKTYKTSRSIAMEPIPYQWSQQAIRILLEDMIAGSILKRHVVLKDQSVNQRAALFGSKTGRCDTIDLSSASDSVQWELVKALFPPKVLKHLAATRTRDITIHDSIRVRVHKFAPMGSAVCFPVQSLIYSAIVLYISICKTYNLDFRDQKALEGMDLQRALNAVYPERPNYSHNDYVPFCCYGDDIITDSRLTSDVIQALTAIGFMINEDKSFIGEDAFRESCGIECFAGSDVTPFKLKLKTVNRRMNIEVLGGLIDQINLAHDYGLTQTRAALVRAALYYPIEGVKATHDGRNPILFSSDRDLSFSIFHHAPRNSHLRTRNDMFSSKKTTSAYYQRAEVRSIGARATIAWKERKSLAKKRFYVYDNYFYTQYWRANRSSLLDDSEDVGMVSPISPLKKRRVFNQYVADVIAGKAILPEPGQRIDTLGVGVRWRWTAI